MPKIPVLGNVPKGGLFAGGLAVVGVGGYLFYRHYQKTKTAATSTSAYGYGSSAYGYGQETPGYYGYGASAYGGVGGGAINPYPVGSEYGYGAYGYGYYNPYTGQYLGGNQATGSPTTPTSTPTPTTTTPAPVTGKLQYITSNGKLNLQQLTKRYGIGKLHLLELNPHLKYLKGTGKPIPNGTKVLI